MIRGFDGDKALVPGTLFGVRSFAVSKHGGLLPISVGPEWNTEEEAECHQHHLNHNGIPAPVSTCECGLYGYYSPEYDEVHTPVHPSAIIEASGSVVLGDRGFRAGKATIRAIALPERTRMKKLFIKSVLVQLGTAVFFIAALLFSLVADKIPQQVFSIALIVTVISIFLILPHTETSMKNLSNSTLWFMKDSKIRKKVKERYPSVCFYDNREDMINDYQEKLKSSEELARRNSNPAIQKRAPAAPSSDLPHWMEPLSERKTT